MAADDIETMVRRLHQNWSEFSQATAEKARQVAFEAAQAEWRAIVTKHFGGDLNRATQWALSNGLSDDVVTSLSVGNRGYPVVGSPQRPDPGPPRRRGVVVQPRMNPFTGQR